MPFNICLSRSLCRATQRVAARIRFREISHEKLTSERKFSAVVGFGNGTKRQRSGGTRIYETGIPKGALDGKTKELIGLAVAAQIPCEYCIYYHTKAAKADGATDAQIKEAVASAALVRKWSTMLNGSSYDRQKFQQQVDSIFASH